MSQETAVPPTENAVEPMLAHLRTEDWEPSERRDIWTQIAHPYVGFEPAPDVPLKAEMDILLDNACSVGTMRSSAYDMHTGPRWQQPEDKVVINLIQSGEMRPDTLPRRGPGALGLGSLREAAQYRWTQGTRYAFVILPHHDVRAALGRDPAAGLHIDPTRCALAPALTSQMIHMTQLLRQRAPLDSTEIAGLRDATRALALLMLRNLGRQGVGTDLPDLHESLHAGRRAAALRFMELHAHHHELDAAAIAKGAGCSRTRLYEAFAEHNATVMGALREIRLQHAKVLIEKSPVLHLGSISWRCGFVDQSGFTKLFKSRFGMLPREWHWQTWMRPGE